MKLAFVVPFRNISTFTKNLEFISRIGYDGAELAIQDPAKVDLDAVKNIIQELGLEVPAIATGSAYTKEGLSLSSPKAKIRKKATMMMYR